MKSKVLQILLLWLLFLPRELFSKKTSQQKKKINSAFYCFQMPLPVPVVTCVSFLSDWHCHSLRSAFFHSLAGLPRFLRLQPSVVLYLLWELAAFFPSALLWIPGFWITFYTGWLSIFYSSEYTVGPSETLPFPLTCGCSLNFPLPIKQWLELWSSQLYFHLTSLLAEVGVGGDMLFCLPTSCFSGNLPLSFWELILREK